MTNNYIKVEKYDLERKNLFSKIKDTLPGIDILPYPEKGVPFG